MRWRNTKRAKKAKVIVVKRLSVIQQEFSLSGVRAPQSVTLIRHSLDLRENVTCYLMPIDMHYYIQLSLLYTVSDFSKHSS